jgi:YYY domain-containing protein
MFQVVFEWLAREGWIILSWWLLVSLAGIAVFPLCVRLLPGLPDRGYTLARAAGLLVVGWVFWLLGSLGFLQNTIGSVILAWLIVLAAGLVIYAGGERLDFRAWWRENRTVVIAAEVLFAVLFLGWAIVRAHQNGLTGTEKPMDLMFISSIMRSPAFPPNDGWLAGYSISYYYFGYFIAATLSMMSGIASTTGFNILIALLFALTGLTAFGVVYNLVRSRASEPVLSNKRKHDEIQADGYEVITPRPAIIAGLLASVMVVLMGNFQAIMVEAPFQSRTASEAYLSFTGTQAREVYPERQQAREAGIPDTEPVTLSPGRFDPAQWGSWWWFRASRVLNDFNLDGTVSTAAQPIDEFPQFSFLLADNHPHVMALPFVLLSIGLALNLLLVKRDRTLAETLFYGLCLGALVFLNTWDVLTGVMAILGADGLRRLMRGQGRLAAADWWGLARFAITLGVLALIFYLPFLVSFRSQASGILPNVVSPTYFQQYFIMFGPFVLILAFFLATEVWRGGSRMNWLFGLQVALAVLVTLLFVLLLFVLLALQFPELNSVILQFAAPYGGLNNAISLVLQRRLEGLLTTIVLLTGIVIVIGRLFPRRPWMSGIYDEENDVANLEERIVINYPPATGFALLLAGIGLLLTLVPEFFYLRDNFGTRINTIFKFYYQAWLVFSLASGYAVYTILADHRLRLTGQVFRGAFAAVALAAISAGLVYPLLAVPERMFNEVRYFPTSRTETGGLTLDGGSSLIGASDYASIMCLKSEVADQQPVVISEAIGGAYDPNFGRVAALTGNPILLGWENHERQWRGATYSQVTGTRPDDIERLYTDLRWDMAISVIQKYAIDYIFYGASERAEYGSPGEEKFRDNLEAVCQRGDSVFYRVTDTALEVAVR